MHRMFGMLKLRNFQTRTFYASPEKNETLQHKPKEIPSLKLTHLKKLQKKTQSSPFFLFRPPAKCYVRLLGDT